MSTVDSLRNWYRARATSVRRKGGQLKARIGWNWARLWPELTCRIELGAALSVPSKSQIARGLYEGFYEGPERAFLLKYLRPADVFYDIGANVGLYSVLAATAIGSQGRVYAFEPNEESLHFLRRNLARIRGCRTQVFSLAVSDVEGTLELSVPTQGYDAWATLGAVTTVDTPVVRREIRAATLDGLHASEGLAAPTVVKIDVEGWELHVLDGAGTVLKSSDPPLLMVELCDRASEGAGSSTLELLSAIEALGMEVFELSKESPALVPLRRRDSYPYLNVFAAAPGSSAWRRVQEVLSK